MIERIQAWLRARTARERMLLQGAVVLVLFVLLPLVAYQSAARFREEARAELAGAMAIAANVEKLSKAAAARPQGVDAGDGSLRSVASANAQAAGLSLVSIEPSGGDRLRLAFEDADSRAVYRWMDAMAKRGVVIAKTSITRSGDTPQVRAEFEIAPAP